MKKEKLIFYYLAGWIVFISYVFTDNLVNARGATPYVWSNLTAAFLEFTFCFFFLYPKFLKRRRLPVFLTGLLAADLIFVGARALIEEVFYVWLIGHGNYYAGTSVWYYINDNWWRAIQPILFSFIAWAFLDTLAKEKQTEELTQANIQAEMLFLKTQINPHFLYNTLNYLYSLAYPLSDRLADGLIKLSGLMRYMLNESDNGMLGLQNEIDYISNFIELYRLRFDEQFHVDYLVRGNFQGKKIASLILIPFIENAFKHGVYNDPGCPISIHIEVHDEQLDLKVWNRISYDKKDSSSGIGLVNIRRRLSLIYPGNHDLQISDDGHSYCATLNIKLKS
ncbi:MAG TPA: sensor histidine kinase [Mucilaginibacter sp.]|nr:sensor histidine kinase [Mucilaginibacter sp.]